MSPTYQRTSDVFLHAQYLARRSPQLPPSTPLRSFMPPPLVSAMSTPMYSELPPAHALTAALTADAISRSSSAPVGAAAPVLQQYRGLKPGLPSAGAGAGSAVIPSPGFDIGLVDLADSAAFGAAFAAAAFRVADEPLGDGKPAAPSLAAAVPRDGAGALLSSAAVTAARVGRTQSSGIGPLGASGSDGSGARAVSAASSAVGDTVAGDAVPGAPSTLHVRAGSTGGAGGAGHSGVSVGVGAGASLTPVDVPVKDWGFSFRPFVQELMAEASPVSDMASPVPAVGVASDQRYARCVPCPVGGTLTSVPCPSLGVFVNCNAFRVKHWGVAEHSLLVVVVVAVTARTRRCCRV